MSNFLEVDPKVLENNLLIKKSTAEDEFESFLRSKDNYLNDNASWKIATPTAGFCVKTTDSNNKKVFINICKLNEIPEPRDITEAELLELWQSDEVPDFRIPLSIQEPHHEFDKSGNPTVAFDVALNTNFFKKVQTNSVFRSFVLQVVLESLENKYELELKKDAYVILQNRKCLGELRAHRIRTNKVGSSKPLIEEIHGVNGHSQLTSPVSSGNNSEIGKKTPQFRIYEDLRLKCVIGEFHLPSVVTIKELKLDVNDQRIILNHRLYFADVFIPAEIDPATTTSTFNSTTNFLTIQMPSAASQ